MLEAMPPCDAVGAKWIKDRWVTNWGGTDLEMVSAPVMLSDETLDHLNRSCAEKKVPRDAFFDCFLQFLTGRLADAALVIKDPRTKRDIGAQIVSVMHDDDLTDSEAKGFLFDIAKEWMGGRATGHWGKSMYQDRLCYDQSRVESEQLMFEEFSVGTL